MAIIQESNAVFYHPLDDKRAGFPLAAMKWSGNSTFDTAKVSSGAHPGDGTVMAWTTNTGTGGAAVDFLGSRVIRVKQGNTVPEVSVGVLDATNTTWGADTIATGAPVAVGGSQRIVWVGDDGFILSYKSGSNTNNVIAGTVSGTTVTLGSVANPNSSVNTAEILRVGHGSGFAVILFYFVSPNMFSVVLTRTGTSVSVGAQTATGSATGEIAFTRLPDVDEFIIMYKRSDIQAGLTRVGRIVGTQVFYTSESQFFAGSGGNPDGLNMVGNFGITAPCKHVVVVAYTANGGGLPPGQTLQHKAGMVNYNTFGNVAIGWGTSAGHRNFGNVNGLDVQAIDESSFVSIYSGTGGPNEARTNFGIITGGGAEITFVGEADWIAPVTSVAPTTTWDAIELPEGSRIVVATGGGLTLGGREAPTALAFGQGLADAGEENGIKNGVEGLAVARLADDRFVVAYVKPDDSGHGAVMVVDASGETVTPLTAEKKFLTGNATPPTGARIGLAALDSTRFIVCYRDTNDSNKGKAKVGLLSGTDITFGAASEFSTDSNASGVAALAPDKVVVHYSDVGGSNSQVKAADIGGILGLDIFFAVSGTAVRAGTSGFPQAETLDATRAIVSTDANVRVVTVVGTVITLGAVTTAITGSNGAIVVLAPTSIAVFSSSGDMHAGTVAGSTVTLGPAATYSASTATHTSAVDIGSGNFVVVWRRSTTNTIQTAAGTVSGLSVTLGAIQDLSDDPRAPDWAATARLSPDRVAACYINKWESCRDPSNQVNSAVARVLETDFSVSPHLTVVGGTRLAFAAWLGKAAPAPVTTAPGTTTPPPPPAPGAQEFVTPGTFEFTVPLDVHEVRVAVMGAGGGGSGLNNAGGGGGGFAYHDSLPVTPGQIVQVEVGVGGGGQNGAAAPGGESSFLEVLASGGWGGTSGTTATAPGLGTGGTSNGSGGSGGKSAGPGSGINGGGGGGSGTAAAGGPGSVNSAFQAAPGIWAGTGAVTESGGGGGHGSTTSTGTAGGAGAGNGGNGGAGGNAGGTGGNGVNATTRSSGAGIGGAPDGIAGGGGGGGGYGGGGGGGTTSGFTSLGGWGGDGYVKISWG